MTIEGVFDVSKKHLLFNFDRQLMETDTGKTVVIFYVPKSDIKWQNW